MSQDHNSDNESQGSLPPPAYFKLTTTERAALDWHFSSIVNQVTNPTPVFFRNFVEGVLIDKDAGGNRLRNIVNAYSEEQVNKVARSI